MTSATIAVAFGNSPDDIVERLRAPSGNRDRCAGIRERVRNRRADAGSAAGDQRVLAGQRAHHTFPVMMSGRDLRR